MSEMKTLVINGQTYQVTDSGAVAFNKEQLLTEEEKAKARENIGASAKASVKIENGVLVVEGGGSGGASADLPIVVAKFESTDDGATYYSTTHTAEEIRGELLAGTPVIALVTDPHLPRVVTCSCWTEDTMVYVGVPIFDGGWQHDFMNADHYADGDTSNQTMGNELWVEF